MSVRAPSRLARMRLRSSRPLSMALASKYTWTTVPLENTATTVPVAGSTSAVASRTSTPVIFLISCRRASRAGGEELTMKLLHLRRAGRRPGERVLGRRQGSMHRDHQGALALDDGHGLGLDSRPRALERLSSTSDPVGHRLLTLGVVHRSPPAGCGAVTQQKSRRDRTPSGIPSRRLTLQRGPPARPGCSSFSHPTIVRSELSPWSRARSANGDSISLQPKPQANSPPGACLSLLGLAHQRRFRKREEHHLLARHGG